MKRLPIYIIALLISTSAILSSFTNLKEVTNKTSLPPNEVETLLNYLEENDTYINTDVQLLIPAAEVKKNLKNPKYHLIDIRSYTWFEYGHIKVANNVKSTDLLNYFETKISPGDFDKIILICYSGQSAAYFTSLLRLAGYDNTYSMKWGMSSWRVDFAENSWSKNTKNKFADKLETKVNSKPGQGTLPVLNTGKTDAKEILRSRLEKAFATPYSDYIIKSTDVFENLDQYYVVNYWDGDKYNNGHIPGAVQYEPQTSMSSSADLLTLPTDKKIVLYGSTGQNTAYVVAYLNILGYDIGNLGYGANSFMHKILKEKKWDAFGTKEINMFPVVE